MPKTKEKKCFGDDRRTSLKDYNVGHTWFGNEIDDNSTAINGHTELDISDLSFKSASGRKIIIESDDVPTSSRTDDSNFMTVSGNRLIDLEILDAQLAVSALCKNCKEGKVKLWENVQDRHGWASSLELRCTNAELVTEWCIQLYIEKS